ncbi:hypothetical protein DFH06DRAFT_1393918 [Mycena polygramma]|nr:hypothetical protein DFH06DRAFT_1393918 [Mycena polygramma]
MTGLGLRLALLVLKAGMSGRTQPRISGRESAGEISAGVGGRMLNHPDLVATLARLTLIVRDASRQRYFCKESNPAGGKRAAKQCKSHEANEGSPLTWSPFVGRGQKSFSPAIWMNRQLTKLVTLCRAGARRPDAESGMRRGDIGYSHCVTAALPWVHIFNVGRATTGGQLEQCGRISEPTLEPGSVWTDLCRGDRKDRRARITAGCQTSGTNHALRLIIGRLQEGPCWSTSPSGRREDQKWNTAVTRIDRCLVAGHVTRNPEHSPNSQLPTRCSRNCQPPPCISQLAPARCRSAAAFKRQIDVFKHWVSDKGVAMASRESGACAGLCTGMGVVAANTRPRRFTANSYVGIHLERYMGGCTSTTSFRPRVLGATDIDTSPAGNTYLPHVCGSLISIPHPYQRASVLPGLEWPGGDALSDRVELVLDLNEPTMIRPLDGTVWQSCYESDELDTESRRLQNLGWINIDVYPGTVRELPVGKGETARKNGSTTALTDRRTSAINDVFDFSSTLSCLPISVRLPLTLKDDNTRAERKHAPMTLPLFKSSRVRRLGNSSHGFLLPVLSLNLNNCAQLEFGLAAGHNNVQIWPVIRQMPSAFHITSDASVAGRIPTICLPGHLFQGNAPEEHATIPPVRRKSPQVLGQHPAIARHGWNTISAALAPIQAQIHATASRPAANPWGFVEVTAGRLTSFKFIQLLPPKSFIIQPHSSFFMLRGQTGSAPVDGPSTGIDLLQASFPGAWHPTVPHPRPEPPSKYASIAHAKQSAIWADLGVGIRSIGSFLRGRMLTLTRAVFAPEPRNEYIPLHLSHALAKIQPRDANIFPQLETGKSTSIRANLNKLATANGFHRSPIVNRPNAGWVKTGCGERAATGAAAVGWTRGAGLSVRSQPRGIEPKASDGAHA